MRLFLPTVIALFCITGMQKALALTLSRGARAALASPSFRNSELFMSSSAQAGGIENISVKAFDAILKGPTRSDYQIIDVRESDELTQLALPGDDVIHLPLSQIESWGGKVTAGELLEREKPVLGMCKMGGRSLKVSTFLSGQAKFAKVINVEGGIMKYASDVDASVVK
jgi:rhodanese-related sulfurtransferase